MIELSTTWQQAISALIHEDFDAAYYILDGAYSEANRSERAQLSLLAASLHSLYGDTAVEDTRNALREAATLNPQLRDDALFLALNAEASARENPTRGAQLAEQALNATSTLPIEHATTLAHYHAMVAFALAEQPARSLEVAPSATELPVHLRWRLRSWQADGEEQLGHHEDAAGLYAEAAHLSKGLNRAIMLQELVAVLLQLNRHEEAHETLDRARAEYQGAPDEELHLASWHYLRAQAALGLARHQEALQDIQTASRLERNSGDPSYGVELVWGQVLMALGDADAATRHFAEALNLARPEDRPFALHELGVAYLDQDMPVEARERLQEVLTHDEYPFLPEVYADLAEAEYRLGRLQEAEANAQYALSQGATIPASLVLGSVALDYYHLDEALEHYERVAQEAAPGSREWVTAHQMAADVLAQLGFRDAGAIYSHASLALEHTDPSDEWHATLRELMTRAEEQLRGGGNRTLN